MSKGQGEVREVPFLKNDMKDQAPTTGRPIDKADAPGKADSEWTEVKAPPQPERSAAVSDAQLDKPTENKR